jgi:hypothetical protein
MDTEWTTIVNKKRCKKDTASHNSELEQKQPTEYIPREGYRLMKPSDYTLTSDEWTTIRALNPEISCICCDTDKISELLDRSVYRCYRCLCCEHRGLYCDEMYWDEMCCIYVNDASRSAYMSSVPSTLSLKKYVEDDKEDEANQVYDDYKHNKLRKKR